jgi:putative acetyltransferase
VSCRPERGEDAAAIRSILMAAFAGNAEADLVERLRRDGDLVLALVAEEEGTVCGYVAFPRLTVETDDGAHDAVGLAPVGVTPEYQRRGIGSALIRAGHRQLADAGERLVIVLGHPEYYPRFGFSAAAAAAFQAPWSGPAFMALALSPDAPIAGRVSYPRAFFEA